MISRLHIENIAVIENADIDFRNGFIALTGETGAGKSILIDSINILLGNRASRDLVRTGCSKAFVSAEFDNVAGLEKLFSEYGVPDEGNGSIFLSRELSFEGKSVARINSRPVPASVLKEFGKRLITIHGQQDNGTLLDTSTHLSFLDSYAKNGNKLNEYRTSYRKFRSIKKEIDKLTLDDDEKARRVDTLTYQINEIEAAEPVEGEDEDLADRKKVLSGAEKIIESLSAARTILSDGEYNVSEMFSQAVTNLESVSEFSDELEDFASRSENVLAEIDSLADDVRTLADRFDFNPRELDEIEDRLGVINSLKRKYGRTIGEINSYLADAKAQLAQIEYSDEAILKLDAELAKAHDELVENAQILTDSRRKAAEEVKREVTKELSELEMPKVRVEVRIDKKKYSFDGADDVEFLISTNVGENVKPLSSVASGGELSRIMLALRKILSSPEKNETLIFDEIDTGVSGKASVRIAQKMKQMSKMAQVITVTHLAQIAAYADEHLKIEKKDNGQRTFTTVTELDEEGRIEELARLLGGDIASSAVETAKDMLVSAKKFN